MKITFSFFFLLFLLQGQLLAELIDINTEKAVENKYGPFAKNRLTAINEDLLKELKSASDIKKLNVVNTWVNAIKYKSDEEVYGVSDYWATLYEFIGKNQGDCEDYTIAKYYILKELGIDPGRLKFAYVIYQDRTGKQISHMVLAYLKVPKPKSKEDILILGNNNKLVLPASKRPDLIKVVKMINGDTGPKSKKWKQLEADMKRKKI
jgi:predicted transglutaminase-like cysteine proteinase